MVSFRVSAKNFSLTFPQCTATLEELHNHLLTFIPSYLVTSQELHEDGNTHYHAAIGFTTKKNIKNQRFFDYLTFHCNLQATKNVKDWIAYVKKDGIFLHFGLETDASVGRNTPLSDISSEDLFNHCVAKGIGYGYYQEEKKRRNTVDINITEETSNPGKMNFYLESLVPSPTDHSIILLGPTGCGKTTWAIKHSIKPSLLVSHIDQLKQFKPNFHKSIIFDDMDFTHWPRTSQIHLVDYDQPRAIHIRYGIINIPKEIQKIFTCNEFPLATDTAINRRIKIYGC